MTTIQHHGIILTNPDSAEFDRPPQREWPRGCRSYGDSFLVWGEHRLGEIENDHTLHVIYEGSRPIADVRASLQNFLQRGERMIDYATTSDKEDWSENGSTFYLEDFQ